MADSRRAVRQAVELLHRALADELGGTSHDQAIQLSVELAPAGDDPEAALTAATTETLAALRDQVSALRGDDVEAWPWPSGQVVDLRDERLEISVPAPDERMVFVGYEANGAPRWINFGQWLIDQGHEEQHLLFERPPALVTVTRTGEELLSQVLPAFRPSPRSLIVHGAVAAGWFDLPEPRGGTRPMALTFLVQSTARGATDRSRRLRLEVVASGPGGEPLDQTILRFDLPPWQPAVTWARKVLDSIERETARLPPPKLEARVQGVLEV